jgi:hypothetical protein
MDFVRDDDGEVLSAGPGGPPNRRNFGPNTRKPVRGADDTARMAERILLVAGALLLVIGPALQAVTELREYRELLNALQETQLPGVARDAIDLSVNISIAVLRPLGLLAIIPDLVRWVGRFTVALNAFSTKASAGNKEAARIQAGLARARNWTIVLFGSLLILSAAIIELVNWITSGTSR